MVLLTLIHKVAGVVTAREKNRSTILFSAKDKAETWLIAHGFVYGECDVFKPTGNPYWFHQKDTAWDFVQVFLQEAELDQVDDIDWISKLSLRSPHFTY